MLHCKVQATKHVGHASLFCWEYCLFLKWQKSVLVISQGGWSLTWAPFFLLVVSNFQLLWHHPDLTRECIDHLSHTNCPVWYTSCITPWHLLTPPVSCACQCSHYMVLRNTILSFVIQIMYCLACGDVLTLFTCRLTPEVDIFTDHVSMCVAPSQPSSYLYFVSALILVLLYGSSHYYPRQGPFSHF